MTLQASMDVAPRERAAFRVALPLLGALALFDVYIAYSYFQDPTWQTLFTGVLSYVSTAIVGAGTWLIRRGRVPLGATLMAVTIQVALFVSLALGSGLGVLNAVIGVLISTAIVIQALSGRLATGVVISSLVLGVATILGDLYWPASRPITTSPVVTAGVTAAMLLIYGIVILRQFRNFSLRSKLIIVFVGITGLTVATIGYITDRNTRQQLTDAVGLNTKTVADTQAATIGELLGRFVSQLNALGVSRTLQTQVQTVNAQYPTDPAAQQSRLERLDQQWTSAPDGDSATPLIDSVLHNEVSEELRQFSLTFPDHVEVFITDQYGGNVAATDRTSDYYQADEAWWQTAYNNGLGSIYIGQPAFDESAGTYATIIAAPLYSYGTHQVIGVLRTTVRLSALLAVLNSNLGLAGQTELLMPAGQMLSGDGSFTPLPAETLQLLDAGSSANFVQAVLHENEYIVGQSRVFAPDQAALVAVRNLGWRVLVELKPAAVFAPVDRAARLIVLVSLGALLAAALLAVAVAQFLAGPIIRLTSVAEQVRAGNLAAQARAEGQDEIAVLAGTFNEMTSQLRQTLGQLEQRVADRTRALAASAEVSRRLSTLLDQRQLVSEVVEQIQKAFNFYHAHIYLFDASRENLVMAGGTGEAGRQMLARGHALPKGRGLVGRAAETNRPVLVPDVTQDPNWLPNPLLPETKSEVAVPITLGTQVLGVLDVQHNVVNGLTPDDAQLIRAIADQLAVALQNARQYAVTSQQAQHDAALNVIAQKIQSAGSVEDVLQVAARELGQALGLRRAAAQLGVRAKDGNGKS